jgi:hypothetical protein
VTRAFRWLRIDVGALAFFALALVVYIFSNPVRSNLYNHFVWQADAFLHGRFAIPWPVYLGGGAGFGNYYFQDVMPLPDQPGYGLIPYPPLPAFLLLPLVALLGQGTDAAMVAAVVGALNVALAWRVARALTRSAPQAMLATVFYGFGTVAWYAAAVGSTWFLAHVVASACLFLAISLAIRSDLGVRLGAAGAAAAAVPTLAAARRRRFFDPRQFVTGVTFGLATLARLPTILGAPFFALVGRGGFVTRAFSAGIGGALPVFLLLVYNVVSSGSVFHPAYDYAYRTEYSPRPELIHPEWAPEDVRYVPQNLGIMLGSLPIVRPECGLSLLDPSCPLLQPDPIGMSLLLISPGYLLAGGLVLRRRRRPDPAAAPARQDPGADPATRDPVAGVATRNLAAARATAAASFREWLPSGFERRAVAGALLAVLTIALADLAHFSQGWVQVGYRFSNDFAPFALVLVALGIGRAGVRPLSLALVAISVLVNAWGVYWGVVLGW